MLKTGTIAGLSLSGSCVGGLILAPALNVVVQNYGWKIAIPIFLPVNASGQPLHVVAEVLASPEKALRPLARHATPKCLHIL